LLGVGFKYFLKLIFIEHVGLHLFHFNFFYLITIVPGVFPVFFIVFLNCNCDFGGFAEHAFALFLAHVLVNKFLAVVLIRVPGGLGAEVLIVILTAQLVFKCILFCPVETLIYSWRVRLQGPKFIRGFGGNHR
jgi:hypothetical protein